MAWMKEIIKIPKYLSKKEREAIAIEILERIVERTTSESLDAKGKPFPKYSKSYTESLDFKIAGKGKKVDLTLSGDMLADMKLLKTKPGEIVIGFEKGSLSNDKAEGNIIGSYGRPTGNRKKARDFLGITKEEKLEILEKYPRNDVDERSSRASDILSISDFSEGITAKIFIEDPDE